YLFITGRLKELINRGGEKVAPWEVDEVLMDHSAVAQAVTFAVPHTQLGEDIAAAVVLHQNAQATDNDIRQFAATRLADFKVPSHVYIVDEIPKGPTGKMQRIGLAAKLGLTAPEQVQPDGYGISCKPVSEANYAAPWTEVERILAKIWQEVLHVEQVSAQHNFFDLGGNSLDIVQVHNKLQDTFRRDISITEVFKYPTISSLAKYLSQEQSEQSSLQESQARGRSRRDLMKRRQRSS